MATEDTNDGDWTLDPEKEKLLKTTKYGDLSEEEKKYHRLYSVQFAIHFKGCTKERAERDYDWWLRWRETWNQKIKSQQNDE
jgi:hypothetical protein